MAPSRQGGTGPRRRREATSVGALDAALRYLLGRPRSRWEVRRHLEGRGHETAAVEEALRALAARGYLDDQALADSCVERAAEGHPMGRLRIANELGRRGVDGATMDQALRAFSPEREQAALDRALSKAARALRAAPADVARRRLAMRLRRLGFPEDRVRSVVEAWLRSRGETAGGQEGEVES